MTSVPFDRSPVADPGALGIDPEALDALFERVRKEVDGGLLPSCQLALARDGKVAATRAFGAPPDSR